jgi:hypothetical protein
LVINQSQEKFSGYIQVDTIETKSGDIINKEIEKITIDCDTIKTIDESKKLDGKYIFVATLLDENKTFINRNYFCVKKWKYITLPKSDIIMKSAKKESDKFIIISVDKPTFFIDLYHPKLNFSDRGFIILPGEQKKIKIFKNDINKYRIEEITIFSLNNCLT